MNNNIEVKALRNTESNLKILKEIGERKISKEYHILRNASKIVLVSHYIWEMCDYCNLDKTDDGIIDL